MSTLSLSIPAELVHDAVSAWDALARDAADRDVMIARVGALRSALEALGDAALRAHLDSARPVEAPPATAPPPPVVPAPPPAPAPAVARPPPDLSLLAHALQPEWAREPERSLPHAELPRTRPRFTAGLAALRSAVARLDDEDPRPDAVLQASACAVVAFARAIQDLPHSRSEADALSKLFHRMSAWSKTRRPGVVHGLAREHTPHPFPTWWARYLDEPVSAPPEGPEPLSDVQSAVGRGVDAVSLRAAVKRARERGVPASDPRWATVLGDRLGDLKGDRLTREVLDRAVKLRRRQQREVAEKPARPVEAPPPAETVGRRVAVVGNKPRPALQQRIERAFGVEVDWYGGEMARIGALAARIEGGSVDLVVMLTGFLSHKATGKLIAAAVRADVRVISAGTGGNDTTIQAIRDAWGLGGAT